jgi:hypothetical protein
VRGERASGFFISLPPKFNNDSPYYNIKETLEI